MTVDALFETGIMNGQTNRRMNKQMNGQMNGRTDITISRVAFAYILYLKTLLQLALPSVSAQDGNSDNPYKGTP